MKSRFPIVEIGKHVEHVSRRNRSKADIEVFSVTNSEGFTRSTDYFRKEVFSKDVSSYKVVNPGQFAYNPSRINVGSIDYLRHGSSVLVSPLYVVFECKKNIHADYLLRYLKSDWGNAQIRDSTEGAVRDSLKFKGLESIKIPLPPHGDQIRIAHLLGKVEGLIAQRKQHLQQLDDLLKSVFLEMFGDPVRNEKGWTPAPLEQLGSINRGVSKHRPRNDPKLLGGLHPLIQTGEVSNAGTYITTYTQTYSDLGFAQSKLWPAGTLCITIAANIAQTGILTFDACFPDSVVGFLAHEGESNTLYVLGLFWFFQAILEKNAPAAAQKNINLEILRALSVPKPPIELQREFATIVEKVEGIKSRYQQSLADLEVLYGALSQQAFKGELDLSRVPLPAPAQHIADVTIGDQAAVPEAVAQALPAIDLPDTDNLLAALESAEARNNLLVQWLEVYLSQLDRTPFSVQQFMAAAQTRLAELHPDSDFELGANDYEHIKTWVFNALSAGRLAQAFDDAGNRIELKAPTENNPA